MDWQGAVERLGPGFDFSRIPPRVRAELDGANSLYVACSGGADSVYLLLYLYAYFSSKGRRGLLRVLHFDHALRGKDSDGDAAFVRGLSAGLGIRFLDAKAEWPSDVGSVSESQAREARLGFFRSATGASEDSPAWIATGHHADDVTETMLMRLSRGAGLQGLSAPREVSAAGRGVIFLRPMLGVSREEIQGSLTAAGVAWREDASNQSDANYRARLRKDVVPRWNAVADREVRGGVCRSRSLIAEDAAALDDWANREWENAWNGDSRGLARSVVAGLPVALQRRLLERLVGADGVSASVLDVSLAAIGEGVAETFEVSSGIFLRLGMEFIQRDVRSRVDLKEGWKPFRLPVGTVAYLPSGERVAAGRVDCGEGIWETLRSGCNDDGKSVYLSDLGNIAEFLTVRRRQPGDAFKPFGKSSYKKLKNLFIDRKIVWEDRNRLPVFVWEGEGIVWVPGLPPGADRRLSPAAQTALRLTYER